jgi:hypothetical protein
MRKKVVIALFAVMSWVAVSPTAVNAATCLSWKTIGGSSMCVAWATKGVQVLIAFRDGCFVAASDVTPDLLAAGANTSPSAVVGCNVTATAFSTDAPTSIAFCGPNHVKVACDQPFSFGPTTLGAGTAVQCVEHPDNESQTGENHEQHRCVAAATLANAGALPGCNVCCANAGFGTGACSDLTPVEMNTRIDALYFGGGNEVPSCNNGSNECTVEQTCSINPKKIAFITDPSQGREYQCNIDCVGDACIVPD